MFFEMIFLHLSSTVFILATLILYIKVKSTSLLVMLGSMVMVQVAYWLPSMVNLPVWSSSTQSAIVGSESNVIYDLLQYIQLSGEIISPLAFLFFTISFKNTPKTSTK